MALNTKDFDALVNQQATAIQGQQPLLSNFNPGSILRAIIEAVAGVVMYAQNLLLAIFAMARASTSTGADLDSWMADFGLTRLPAIAATGAVTFARFNPASAATVPVGTAVETSDGSQIFAVIADTTNPAYVPSQNAYAIGVGIGSIDITVQANTPGTGGNVVAGALNTLTSAIVGVDTVTNALAFNNGVDQESDDAFRARFQGFIGTLAQGTVAAVGQAIIDLQADLTYSITENQQYSGATDFGYFYVVVDDGTGSPPSPLLANVTVAIDQVRAAGIRFGVFGPSVLTANLAMTITSAAGYTHANVVAAVVAALQAYVNTLGVGVTLPFTILSFIAYGVPGVTNVSGISINSGTADLVPTAKQVVKTGTVLVT